MNCPMSRQRLESSCATSTFSATRRPTGNGRKISQGAGEAGAAERLAAPWGPFSDKATVPRLSKRILACAIVALAAISLAAQSKSEETATFRADTRLVVLHATVVDKNGKLLTN